MHLIFKSKILYVDLGSTQIVAGKAPGVENILRVKAKEDIPELDTTLSVVTLDGAFYSFRCTYRLSPSKLCIQCSASKPKAELSLGFSFREELLVKKGIEAYKSGKIPRIGKIHQNGSILVAFVSRCGEREIVALKIENRKDSKTREDAAPTDIAFCNRMPRRGRIRTEDGAPRKIIARKECEGLLVFLLEGANQGDKSSLEITVRTPRGVERLTLSQRERKELERWD